MSTLVGGPNQLRRDCCRPCYRVGQGSSGCCKEFIMIKTRSAFGAVAASLVVVIGAYSFSALASQPPATPAPKPDRLAAVRAQLKDPAKPFVLLVKFELKAEPDAEFAKLADAAAAGTRKEPGNIAYEFSSSAGNPKQA